MQILKARQRQRSRSSGGHLEEGYCSNGRWGYGLWTIREQSGAVRPFLLRRSGFPEGSEDSVPDCTPRMVPGGLTIGDSACMLPPIGGFSYEQQFPKTKIS